jgi:hypothetical protein
MRYQPAHAATSGSVPFMLRGPKSVRLAMSAAVAGIIGLVPAVLVASPAMAAEGALSVPSTATAAEGAGTVTVNISRAAATGQTLTAVTWTTADGTATGGADYTAITSGSGSFPAGTTSSPDTVAMTVTIAQDQLYEAGETFSLIAKQGSTTIGTTVVTITDDDTAPSYTLSASPATVSESTATPISTVTATLNTVSGVDTTIRLNTADGTAVAGTSPAGDYTALVNSDIVIAAGTLTQTKVVSITADAVKDEFDTENFTVNGVATGASPANRSTQISITDAESLPTVTLSGGVTAAEGTTTTYTVTLNHESEVPVTVHWDAVAAAAVTGHGAATAGDDFTYPATGSRTVTIPAMTASTTFTVPLKDDLFDELAEDFAIEISAPTASTLGSTTKVTSTITDTDTAPTVSILPVAVTEGDSGTTAKTFTATLSAASGRAVTVDWATAIDDTGLTYAKPLKDYITKNGSLTFPAGTTTQNFTIDIVGDTIDEGSDDTPTSADGETFKINLTRATGDDSFTTGAATTITITDDDAAPTIAFDDISVKEGDTVSAVLLPVKLTGSSDHTLNFDLSDVTTVGHTGTAKEAVSSAVGSDDYDLMGDTITVQPEATTGYGVVLVNGDMIHEADENAFFKVLANAGDNSDDMVTDPDTKTMELILQNDDDAPDLEITNVTGEEGDTVAVKGTVTGMADDDATVNVTFAGASSHGSNAAETTDFTNPGAKAITITKGTAPGTIVDVANVMLAEDTEAEPAETIAVNGLGLNNFGTVTEGIITIAANEGTEEPGEDAITLEASSSFRLGAGNVTLSGTTTPGAMVQPLAQPRSSDDDPEAYGDEVEADEDGNFSFIGHLTTTGVRFAASISGGDVVSDTVTVNVKEDPAFTARSSSKGTATLTVTGDPKVRGLAVRVLRANSNGTWTTVGTGILNADGKFTKMLTGLKSGSSKLFKATVYGNGDVGLMTNTSKSARVTIR